MKYAISTVKHVREENQVATYHIFTNAAKTWESAMKYVNAAKANLPADTKEVWFTTEIATAE